MGKPEDFVEKYLMRRCKAMGFGCLKFTSPGTSGVPDRIVIGNGRTVFVETKRAGEKLRRLQEVITAEMRDQGADVRVADTRELVDEFLAEIAGNPAAGAQTTTPDIMPLQQQEAIINRVQALADSWESTPALRRGSAARELREALTTGPAA